MSPPPSDFAVAFRAHVVPVLRPLIDTHAAAIAAGIMTWDAAEAAIMDTARARGAHRLPKDHLDALMTWIGTQLLAAVDEADKLEAQIRADPVGHYTRLTASCRDPDQMKWVFAAISPEYRRSLNGGR